jgi:energy-coupling factor transporter transmembrane protein EcfT
MKILGSPDRPLRVKQFEWLQLLTVALSLPEFLVAASLTELGVGLVLLAIFVAVIFRASRYGSTFAKWLLFVLFLLTLALTPLGALMPVDGVDAMSAGEWASFGVQAFLQGLSFVCIFSQSAKNWFVDKQHLPQPA